MIQLSNNRLLLSGWALRDFTIDELDSYLKSLEGNPFELSKDIFKSVSIKNIYRSLKQHQISQVSYAGTTNIVSAGGLPFHTYTKYLRIQLAQAQFLNANSFRLLIGDGRSEKVIQRLNEISTEYDSIRFITEIHSGWESEIQNLNSLINSTNIRFVIDFQNIYDSNLSSSNLLEMIPCERVAHFHTRNLTGIYVEDDRIELDELEWRSSFPQAPIYWEPKKLTKEKVISYYEEYQSHH